MKLFEIENGNLHTTIYDDGTKVREFEGTPNPEFPESIDVKITNYCDLACAYCHENSTKEGEHAFLSDLLPLFVDLPQGTELAIGGTNHLPGLPVRPHLLDGPLANQGILRLAVASGNQHSGRIRFP